MLLSERITADLARWGYAFRVDDLDDTILCNGEPLTDFTMAHLHAIARDNHYGRKGFPTIGALDDMVRVMADRNRFHPVRDYLNSLTWDGKNHWGVLSMHFHDEHAPIEYENGTRLRAFSAVLRRWALGAVARAFGETRACQQNAMLVLDSVQEHGQVLLRPVAMFLHS